MGVLLFDLLAAFDRLKVTLLVEKLRLYGAKENVTKWIQSYMTGRQQFVQVGDKASKSQKLQITVTKMTKDQ